MIDHIFNTKAGQGKSYLPPAVRIVTSQLEWNFLVSNLESIVDDGSEYEWD